MSKSNKSKSSPKQKRQKRQKKQKGHNTWVTVTPTEATEESPVIPEVRHKSYKEIAKETVDEKIEKFRKLSSGVFSLDASDLLVIEKDFATPLDRLREKISEFDEKKMEGDEASITNRSLMDELAELMKHYDDLKKQEESAIVNRIGNLKKALAKTELKSKISRSEKDIQKRSDSNSILDLEV